ARSKSKIKEQEQDQGARARSRSKSKIKEQEQDKEQEGDLTRISHKCRQRTSRRGRERGGRGGRWRPGCPIRRVARVACPTSRQRNARDWKNGGCGLEEWNCGLRQGGFGRAGPQRRREGGIGAMGGRRRFGESEA